MKAVVLTASIVAAVVILWTPYIIGDLMMIVGSSSASATVSTLGQQIHDVGAVLGFLNTTLNWIIYGVASSAMRKALKRILHCGSDEQVEGQQINDATTISTIS